MDGTDNGPTSICEQNRNAIGRLNAKQRAAHSSDCRIPNARLVRCPGIFHIVDYFGMRLVQFQDWPARNTSCSQEARTVDGNHGIVRRCRAESQLIVFGTSGRKCMENIGNGIEQRRVKQRYLRNAFCL